MKQYRVGYTKITSPEILDRLSWIRRQSIDGDVDLPDDFLQAVLTGEEFASIACKFIFVHQIDAVRFKVKFGGR